MIAIGVDCGTSGLKAVLAEAGGGLIAAATRAYRPDRPRPLWSEQDPEVWVAAMFDALGELRSAAPEAFAATGAIGFSGQMHGAVLIGRDGKPLRPAILHNDGRAHREAAELWERHRPLADVVGVKPMAGFVAPKLIWLARHEPAIFAAIAHVIQPKDYLRFRLTGEIASDMSDAAGTWWLDEQARAWSIEALAASGVDPACAPRLVEGSDAVGTLTPAVADALGLPRRIVVAAGGGDAAVGAVGIGATRPGDAFISLGTASQMIVVSDAYRAAPEKLVAQLRPCAAAPLVSDGGDAQRRRRARLRRPPRRRRRRRARARSGGELSRPGRDDRSCPISPANGRRTTTRTRAASSSASAKPPRASI